MAQYRIEATSEKKTVTVSNVTPTFIANPEEGETTSVATQFPSPADYTSKADADVAAASFAEWLNHEDYDGAWDWVGKATAV